MCLFIEEQWGFDKLVELVRRFNRPAVVTGDAIRATFKIAPAEFDSRFNAYVRQRFAGILNGGEVWEDAMREANMAAQQDQWGEAIEPARRAAELFPEYTGADHPQRLLAQALYKTGKRGEAIAALQTYRERGGWDPSALQDLAQWLEEAGQTSAATEVRVAMNYSDPFDTGNHTNLGERLLSEQRPAEALREYRVLLALDTPDQAAAKLGMARAYRALGETANSRRYLLEVLEQAPHYRPAEKLLLEKKEGPTP
jgi:predicted Zn-dependent protease